VYSRHSRYGFTEWRSSSILMRCRGAPSLLVSVGFIRSAAPITSSPPRRLATYRSARLPTTARPRRCGGADRATAEKCRRSSSCFEHGVGRGSRARRGHRPMRSARSRWRGRAYRLARPFAVRILISIWTRRAWWSSPVSTSRCPARVSPHPLLSRRSLEPGRVARRVANSPRLFCAPAASNGFTSNYVTASYIVLSDGTVAVLA